ncbi:hypothetical protein Pcinc_009211 [Petrolisthes cinctipes]|uniref:Uncharacterized protein n=1 Tax=Petrolisthes cinctipes TaxID=88211 RepID=A0AAE1KWS5_PETCI|nr:hypothetical protein Pcinc_009211 [Petrolisthes cinctipes]
MCVGADEEVCNKEECGKLLLFLVSLRRKTIITGVDDLTVLFSRRIKYSIMVYRYRKLVQLGLLGVGGLSVTYNSDELENAAIGAVRFGRAALTIQNQNQKMTCRSSDYTVAKSQSE